MLLVRCPEAGTVGLDETACEVAILSQTCDVIQPTRRYCLVAPAQVSTDTDFSAASKGRKPLFIPLEDGSGRRWVADAGRAFSIPAERLGQATLVSRCPDGDQSPRARAIRSRIARAFGRFPFPDEVHTVLRPLRERLRSKAGSRGNLGRVIDLVSEIRLSADQWERPGRRLSLFVIVPSGLLIPDEEADPDWSWSPSRVNGWTPEDSPGSLPLDRICELIMANANGDRTSRLRLWQQFGVGLGAALIDPHLNDDLVAVTVEVTSDHEFSLNQFRRSESLDLEALSDPDS